ncbi:AAA family ATPase [Kordia sp. YSTF-M3]|uniref:AAA family ATPase n=1 Tax=Kordia aestuariivivens TaxID=2759037 RepID=A0ABR7QBM8_9FLAO|nr:AAA family ATPase [Kordia aestuariivivens]MBC8755987.1 AAA family ATPase [Kordia aestuariivivens]
MAVKRISEIDIENRGLFTAIYGNTTGSEFFVDADLKKYNLWQQLFIFFKELKYDLVMFYDTTHYFHSYSQHDLNRLLNLKNTDKKQQLNEEYLSKHIKSTLGSNRFKKSMEKSQKTNSTPSPALKLSKSDGHKHSFYKTQTTLDFKEYLRQNLTKKNQKTAIIIKTPENAHFEKVDDYITLFKALDNNYDIDKSQNKVIIAYESSSSRSFVNNLTDASKKGYLFLNSYFESLFLKSDGESHTMNKDNVFNIMSPDENEIRNVINLKRLEENFIDFFQKIDLPKTTASLYLDQFNISEIYKQDLNQLASKAINGKSGMSQLQNLIGLKKVKESVNTFIERSQFNKGNQLDDDSRYHLMFTGNPGTGKTIVAKIVAKIFKENQIIKGGKFTETKASDLIAGYVGQTAIKTREVCEQALGGVLFIDEAYELASNQFGKECVGELIQFMENERDQFAVIFAGYEDDMQELLALNEGLNSRIGEVIHFLDYSPEELIDILKLKIKKLPLKIEEGALAHIKDWITQKIAEDAKKFGNGRGIDKLKTSLLDIRIKKKNETISKEDLDTIHKIEKSNVESQLQELIGLKDVKHNIKKFIKRGKFLKDNELSGKRVPRYHLMFTGNPGTGKTIVARIVAQIFKENQIIKGGKFTEVKASDLISKFRGDTADKTKKICKDALGGILFIDEAYALASDKELGQQSMGELIQFMENERDKLVVIFAGYKKDMEALYKLNIGLKRRIGKVIHFPDYSSQELIEIFNLKTKDLPFTLEDDGLDFFQDLVEQRIAEDSVGFGNAGGIDKLIDDIIDIVAENEKQTISKEDLSNAFGIETINSTDELTKLIGLKEVKDKIKTFIMRSKFSKENQLEDNSRYHLMFTGNPGTGKTIVAKIVAKIFKENQIIKGGKFTEVKASDLIAGYLGQTAIKTREVCEKALGGVLFIDEAYTLASNKYGNEYGKECIGELIQFMENERDRLVVIFAGYEEDMQELLKLNEGLDSRISEIIHFPDYSPEELIAILKLKIKKLALKIEETTLMYIKDWITQKTAEDAKKFGNGRGIDKLKTSLLDIRIKKKNEIITTDDLKNIFK